MTSFGPPGGPTLQPPPRLSLQHAPLPTQTYSTVPKVIGAVGWLTRTDIDYEPPSALALATNVAVYVPSPSSTNADISTSSHG